MALLDFLKKKKEREQAKEKGGVKKTAPVSPAGGTDEKFSRRPAPVKPSARSRGFSYDAVRAPHVTEKASRLAERSNSYVFKVADANKEEIKGAIEGIYGVTVLRVRTLRIPQKRRRLGRTEGFKKGYRKAMVTLKKGDTIEII